jgi:hypothetical protein
MKHISCFSIYFPHYFPHFENLSTFQIFWRAAPALSSASYAYTAMFIDLLISLNYGNTLE